MPSVPLKYLVPNAFTAMSLLLGLASIACSAHGDFELAAWMVLWCTLLDKADGTAARLFRATSKFGMEFDSFADFVAFGIAPAALLYFRLSPGGGGYPGATVILGSGVYAVALAVRLSRFNIATGPDTIFHGVPGTLMGGVLASAYLTHAKYHLPVETLSYAPALFVVAALLMVSTLRLPKLKMRKNKAFNVFTAANVLAAYVLGPLRLMPEYLFGLASLYLVGGVIAGMRGHEEGEAEAEGKAA